jgi:acyl carrier protein
MTTNHEGVAALGGEAGESQEDWRAKSDKSGAIRDWLVAQFAEILGIPPQEIDPNEPLMGYGLGSIQALTLVADLEDWLGRELPATLLWDCPTMGELIKYLSQEPAA